MSKDIHNNLCGIIKYGQKPICIPITLNNPLEVIFFNKKYSITILTRPTQIVKVYFILKTGF